MKLRKIAWMKSNKPDKPLYAHKIPTLSAEVEAETIDGEYIIHEPYEYKSVLKVDGETKCDTIQLRCRSLYTRAGDEIHKCNATVKTIVGDGCGDQTEIVECGKCRTAYLIRQQYIDGKLVLRMSVWGTSRNINNLGFRFTNKKGDYIIRFNH